MGPSASPRAARAWSVAVLVQERKRADHVRGPDRRRRVQIGCVERREAIDAQKAQTDPDLLFQELEYPYEARLAGGGEAAAGETADPDGLRAERDRLDDVGAAHERAVDDDRR